MTAATLPAVHRRRLAVVLEEGLEALDLSLSSHQASQLLSFIELIVRWNRTYNLTAIREPMAMLTHHILDCLAIVPPLRRELACAKNGGQLLDVGAGAGLPGVVIAIAAPETVVVGIDSVGKKAAFLGHVAATLSLSNLSSRHERVESFAGPTFNVIASRAFASLASFAQSTRHLLSPGGSWLAMKADPSPAELEAATRESLVFHVEPVTVPGLDAVRSIVWMQPRSVCSLSESASS